MPTLRDRIVAYLPQDPAGADDDQLSESLGIRPRQAVNQICRCLSADGLVTRHREGADGKIVNRWIGDRTTGMGLAGINGGSPTLAPGNVDPFMEMLNRFLADAKVLNQVASEIDAISGRGR